jgi:lipoate-protein ligase A
MQFLDLTLPSLAENLALDEALLDEAEASGGPRECLRLWESPELAVIVGRSSRVGVEVDQTNCDADHVHVLRRCSGGCAVVIGPGCLMYSVVLSYERHPELRSIDEAHRFVLSRVAQAIGQGASLSGTSDLTASGRKFSGNSLRCKRDHLLYHGTILYDFPLETIARYLLSPPREPDYRGGRSHGEFVTNLPADPRAVRRSLPAAFAAQGTLADWPRGYVEQLVAERYGRAEWHLER